MYILSSKELLTAEDSQYEEDQVVFESSVPGTYNVELLVDGKYEVYIVAGGGKGHHHKTSHISGIAYGGGSGSGFVGIVKLPKGIIPVIVGSGDTNGSGGKNSCIGNFVTTYGGYPADRSGNASGGAVPTVNTEIISTTINRAGYTGTGRDQSSSVYGGYGYGGSGDSSDSQQYGGNSYVKIIYKGK